MPRIYTNGVAKYSDGYRDAFQDYLNKYEWNTPDELLPDLERLMSEDAVPLEPAPNMAGSNNIDNTETTCRPLPKIIPTPKENTQSSQLSAPAQNQSQKMQAVSYKRNPLPGAGFSATRRP
jgi:hypothetical protein